MYPRYHFGWSDLRDAHGRPIQIHRGAAPGALRPARGPARIDEHLRRAAGARRSDAGAPGRLEERSRSPRGQAAARGEIDPDTRTGSPRLATSARSSRPAPDPPDLADPKDKIELFNLITRARDPRRRQRRFGRSHHALIDVVTPGSERDRRVVHARQRVPRAAVHSGDRAATSRRSP